MSANSEFAGSDSIKTAHDTVYDVLSSLSNLEQKRVLKSVSILLGIDSGPDKDAPVRANGLYIAKDNPRGDFSMERTLSPKSFLLDKNPQTDVERVACLAFYLTHYRDIPYFKTFEISELNTEAAQQKLSNPSNSVNNAMKMGYLVAAPEGQKQLSAAGELFVRSLPDRDAAKAAMQNARPRKTLRKKTGNASRKTNE